MRKKSEELRRLAEDFIQQMIEESTIYVSEKGDFITSLVRQWLTYDGNATLFLGEQQFYLVLDRSPLGKLRIMSKLAAASEMRVFMEDWKIDPRELPDILEQLNRGQSADVTTDDGVPVRLWVDPKERSKGVDELNKQPSPPGFKPDYRVLAARTLEPFAQGLDDDELERLIDSATRQWQTYGGHACLFFQRAMFAFILTERPDGSDVTTQEAKSNLERVLASHDVPPEDIPEMIVQINLGHAISYRNRKGIVCRLWHDPRARELFCTQFAPGQDGPSSLPPIFCPKCGATLPPWPAGQQEQRCLLCSQTVART